MLTAYIVKQLIDTKGKSYVVGSYVRVLLKSGNSYIGAIKDIFRDSFVLNIECDDKTILIDTVEKIRTAKPDETFYTHPEF